MRKKLLICGATGFIGRNIAEFFANQENFEVYGTYLNSDPWADDRIRMIQADLTKKEDVEQVIKVIIFDDIIINFLNR